MFWLSNSRDEYDSITPPGYFNQDVLTSIDLDDSFDIRDSLFTQQKQKSVSTGVNMLLNSVDEVTILERANALLDDLGGEDDDEDQVFLTEEEMTGLGEARLSSIQKEETSFSTFVKSPIGTLDRERDGIIKNCIQLVEELQGRCVMN